MDPSGRDKGLGYTTYQDNQQKNESESSAWLNAINAGFTMPDSYSGYLGQQWGNYIAPTVKNDPVGSAYAFKQGFLDAVIPFRSSNDYYYQDLYSTGQMFGMIVTGGISEAMSGINTVAKIPIYGLSPQYSLAGASSYSIAITQTIDGALVAEGITGVLFGWSAGSTTGNSIKNMNSLVESGSNYGYPNGIGNLLDGMSELSGTTREKLLGSIQNEELYKIVDQLYRPGASVGDGGTAAILVDEFNNGSSKHLQKATERLQQLQELQSSGKLGLNDLDMIEALIDDLEYAIGLYN